MSTTISRVPTSFRLPTELLDELKECAKAANRSLNNYVEGILVDVMRKTKKQEYQPRTKEELLNGFDNACKEVKLFQEGKAKLMSFNDMMEQLKKEM